MFHPTPRLCHRLLALVCLMLFALPACAFGNAVEFRDVVYVSLPKLLDVDFLDGRFELTQWGRTIDVHTSAGRVRFDEGGDRIARDEAAPVALHSPVLVLNGEHFIPAEECASYFGYTVEIKPSPALVLGEKRLALEIEPLKPPHLATDVKALKPVRRAVVLAKPLSARPHLHDDTTAVELPPGTRLLVRREVSLNGVPHALVTRADETLDTFAVQRDALAAASTPRDLKGTHLGAVFQRLSSLAADEDSIRHGNRAELVKTISVTVDLCWSLKPFERDFFRFVPRLAARDGEAWITLFQTGRWMAQHPDDMERLIELSRAPGVGITWALHSWSHPKERPFMNSFSPDELRADTLQLEHDLLEWGIVPSLYYRFPGLIHDEERLRAILDLDLISVDCDSWVASMHRDRSPHHLTARDGSILLIHGNGNEPVGIPRLYEWMIEHPGWKWGPLHRFIAAKQEADPLPPTTAPTTAASQRRRRDR